MMKIQAIKHIVQKAKKDTKQEFSDFFRNAPKEEQIALLKRVAQKANKEQKAVVDKYKKTLARKIAR
ncbi:MAG: hypothetical protein WC045_03930 [Patescibacteria group bacterium]